MWYAVSRTQRCTTLNGGNEHGDREKIRELRIARNLTQEALAAELSVTPQAISKWECGTTTPDIQLLPDIAIFFGVTLDELFCLTDDNELDRIQNQIWDSPSAAAGRAGAG